MPSNFRKVINEAKWRGWWKSWGKKNAVKWSEEKEGKIMMKISRLHRCSQVGCREGHGSFIHSVQQLMTLCILLLLLFNMLNFLLIIINSICIVFAVSNVSLIACVVLCAVFCLSIVCYFGILVMSIMSYCSTTTTGKIPAFS
jgi:hypothetical protein